MTAIDKMNSIYDATITYRTDSEISVSVRSKTISIATAAIDLPSLTDEEIATYEKVAIAKQGDSVTLTLSDLHHLVSLRDKWAEELLHRKEVEERLAKNRVMPISATTAKATATATTKAMNREDYDPILTNDTQEYQIRRQTSICRAMKNKTFSVLMYDISSFSNIPNPSRALWSYGAKLNLSCWLIPDQNLASVKEELLVLWDAHKLDVRYHIIPQDPRSHEALSKIIQEEIDRRLIEVHTSLIESIDSISQAIGKLRCAVQPTEKEISKAENAIAGRYRQVIRQAQEGLENLIAWAEKYDESGEYSDLFSGLKTAIETKREIVNHYLQEKGKKLV